ncbi:hypothetical protein GTW43_33965 [Streptomyces sp. SID5785]|uniref:hypothetical protein n=1 Tax=Streptomyces sp. SID5785 TaxID=2690309 RepID=UPI0013617830|nr:hypothetical protein [Streptomyces sp. SID5785]MZD10050.1 hypothetical protein [Streptomyces sp. SID5785]
MTTYTAAVFENGMVARLLDSLVAAGSPAPNSHAQDEIDRVNRVLCSNASVAAALPNATLTALLDLLSEGLGDPTVRRPPAGFLRRLEEVAGQTPLPDFLEATASALRASQRRGIRALDDLPLSVWEAKLRFSQLESFSWWVEGDEYDTFEEGVVAGIGSEHPYGCADRLPPLISECHAARLLDKGSIASLHAVVPWATPPVLVEILRLASAHLLEAH